MGHEHIVDTAIAGRNDLYAAAIREIGPVLDRLAAGYELDPDKRRDLRQEIYLQLWRSLSAYDRRCSLKTWTLRVAHNVAASHVCRERRTRSRLVGLEEIEQTVATRESAPEDVDRHRRLAQLHELIRELKPVDRQIMICWLEELDAAAIADITGLSAANVAMKVHRIKNILARRFREEHRNA